MGVSMKLGIMQPYFLPYIGYFQLINAVDIFVIHDDVQWIKNGWINRNRVLVNGEDRFITLPLLKESSLLNINQRHVSTDIVVQKQKILRQVQESYRKAPYFFEAFELLERCLENTESNISIFVTNTIHEYCSYLNIKTPILLSSAIDKNNALKGQERVIEINKRLGADNYINPHGGVELYSVDAFSKHGIKLQFLRPTSISYQQFKHEHVSHLSILDATMFNTKKELSALLNAYDLF